MKRICTVFLALVLLFILPLTALGEEIPEIKEINTVEDLLSISKDPSGSYILMNDLDMTDVEWHSPDFYGTFDGNGHAIVNLFLSNPGSSKPESYDGNLIAYETNYVGLFGTMQNAEVRNLNLINLRGLVEIDEPCFLAGIAGYFQESTVSDCNVSGTLELRAHDRMFGVGGIAGFGGIGLIENCNVDVTLICTDTDAETKDEQFLGGIYATGFVDVDNCVVHIDGYGSEHGYAHNGGIVGMFMQQPYGMKIMGKLTGNKVYGKITFFEDNRDRRAYCRPIAGETLAFSYSIAKNKYEFERDERKEYDTELRPEMCQDPVYTEEVTSPACDAYGFTTYTCNSCGYQYTDHYTLFAHTVTQWKDTKPATVEFEGMSEGNCDFCGILQQRTIPKLEPEPTITTEPETIPETTLPEPLEPTVKKYPVLPFVLGGIVIGVVLVFLTYPPKKKKGKFEK